MLLPARAFLNDVPISTWRSVGLPLLGSQSEKYSIVPKGIPPTSLGLRSFAEGFDGKVVDSVPMSSRWSIRRAMTAESCTEGMWKSEVNGV